MPVFEGRLKGVGRETLARVYVCDFCDGAKGCWLPADKYNIVRTRQFEVSLCITCFISPLMGGRGYFGLWAS